MSDVVGAATVARATTLAALYCYLSETDGYLISYKRGGPLREDTCCAYHQMRWDSYIAERDSLLQRRDSIVAVIRKLEAPSRNACDVCNRAGDGCYPDPLHAGYWMCVVGPPSRSES
jgi:hypothetical protein